MGCFQLKLHAYSESEISFDGGLWKVSDRFCMSDFVGEKDEYDEKDEH